MYSREQNIFGNLRHVDFFQSIVSEWCQERFGRVRALLSRGARKFQLWLRSSVVLPHRIDWSNCYKFRTNCLIRTTSTIVPEYTMGETLPRATAILSWQEECRFFFSPPVDPPPTTLIHLHLCTWIGPLNFPPPSILNLRHQKSLWTGLLGFWYIGHKVSISARVEFLRP